MKVDHQLYPLKFEPIIKQRLWGGNKLGTILNKAITGQNMGESWEVSGVPGDISIVSNGPLKGVDLQQLIERFGPDLLGEAVYQRFGKEFPILIKFIDADRDLSIQLHPNDELAQERHQSAGKTEMWYIMEAAEDANLILGFNKDISPEEYKSALENGRLLELIHRESVKPGDAYFIKAGTVHAIGGGILLAEIQQTSDITYRIYDYDRRDNDGNLRELHTDLALEAIDYQRNEDRKIRYDRDIGQVNKLLHSPYFKTNFIELSENSKRNLANIDSFTIYICLTGKATLFSENGTITLLRGDTALVPACINSLEIQNSGVSLLEVTI